MKDIVLNGEAFFAAPFSRSDVRLLEELYSDPDSIRFLAGPDEPWSRGMTQAWLEDALSQHETHGFSPFKIYVAPEVAGQDARADETPAAIVEDHVFVGWAGFTTLEETSEISYGHCLAPAFRNGNPKLVNRICSDLTDWFFENTYFSHLVSCLRTDDREARQVIQDQGFEYRESRKIAGQQCDVFQRFSPSLQTLVASA